jgi:adenylate cyclase
MLLRPSGISPGFAGLAVLLALLTAWDLSGNVVRDPLRERAFDLVLPLLPRPANKGPGVVIVDIDRQALARFGAWPWPRGRLADIVAAVAAGKPAALGLDMLLSGPDRFSADGDATLARALSGVPSVLGFVLENVSSSQNLPSTPILLRSPLSLPGVWRADGIVGPLPVLADAAQGFGALVATADPDGPIRRVPLLVLAGGIARPGLAVELVRLTQGAGALLIDPRGILNVGDIALPLGGDATLRLVGSPTVNTISASALIDEPEARAMLADRIVLIGGSAPELGGLRVTPTSPATPSVLIQAEAIDAMLRGDVPARPYWADVAEPIGALTLGLVCLLLAVRLRPALAVSLAIMSCLAWAGAAVAAVRVHQLLVDPAGPPIVALSALAAAVVARFVLDEWRARVLRLSFEQHLAPEVVRRIAADPGALRLRGEMREITALFTDIESFTSMTERAEPRDLVALLDMYFDVATRIVTDHGGMIDKIVGDAIHAIYNAPFELDDHAGRAGASALALLEATEGVRRSPLGQRLRLGRTRVGIETGPAIVGDVGGSRKLDYTAHGNAMNAAARLEAANKDLGSSVCIGPGTAAKLDPATLRQIGTLTPRGQSGEIKVYTPVSLRSRCRKGLA